jgi:uncharacterized protein with HEPN domain
MPSKPPEGYLFDMLEAARKIGRFLEGYDLERFRQDEKTISAVERQFILLGEAAKRVDPTFRAQFPEINFRLATLMRNVVVHHYDRVDLERLWEAAKDDVPGVIQALEPFLEQRRRASEGGS